MKLIKNILANNNSQVGTAVHREPGHYRREHFRSKGFGDTMCRVLGCKGRLLQKLRNKLNKLYEYKTKE